MQGGLPLFYHLYFHSHLLMSVGFPSLHTSEVLFHFILLWLLYCNNHTFRDRIKIRKLKAGRSQWKSPCSHAKYKFYVSCPKIQLATARTKIGLARWHSDKDFSCQTSWLEINPQSPHAGEREITLQVVLWWCTAWHMHCIRTNK